MSWHRPRPTQPLKYNRPAPVAVPVNGFPKSLLALSDTQLEAVMAAANPIAPAKKSEFFEAIAARLAGAELGDGAVARACRELQSLYFSPPDLSHESRWARDAARKSADARRRWSATLPPDAEA
jgi:hypothetical protein